MAISETAGSMGEAESTSQTVVSEVARFTDVAPESLDPLYHTIDSEALNALFDGRGERSPERVSFTYAGCNVVVTGPGEVEVSTADPVPPE